MGDPRTLAGYMCQSFSYPLRRQSLITCITTRYVPIMICRLMLSVRKAALAYEGWESYTRAGPSIFTVSEDHPHSTARFVPAVTSPTEAETINLDYLPRLPR